MNTCKRNPIKKNWPNAKLSHIIRIMAAGLMVIIAVASAGDKAPADIEQLFDNFFREYIELSPETGTQLGVERFGIKVRNDQLDDVSEEGQNRLYAMYKRYSNWLSQYDEKKLSSSQRICRDVLKWFIDSELQGGKFRYHKYIINPMFSFHSQLTTLLTEYHKIEKPKDAEDYIKRLNQYKNRISQLKEQIAIRQKKNIMSPKFVMESFQQELDDFTFVPCSENILYTSFKERVQNLKTLDEKSKEDLCQRALLAIDSIVYPSYIAMRFYVEKLQMRATDDVGVWKLPDGDEYYRYRLRHHTTTKMTPEEIHELGQKEVSRIQEEMKKHFKTLGISGSENFADLLAEYLMIAGNTADERFFYPDNEEGRQQTLTDYQAIIDEMNVKLPEMFDLIPKIPVCVKRVPRHKEGTTFAYYEPPKFGESQLGIFYANLSYQHGKAGMKTLTYHEAIPGHHLQIALEYESPESRLFKTLFFFTGYAEGWALYAEKLAKEYGFFDDIYSKIGNLRSELLRAARLVLDTGIHYKRWTREQAYKYMLNNTGYAYIVQIDRYAVWPGQACAYKIGELKILELREKAKRELGEKFNLKDFHTVVLKHGSVPLELLEQLVDEYIVKFKSGLGH